MGGEAWPWSGGHATLVGFSAAAVLGARWISADLPAELSISDRHCPKGIVGHTYALEPDECVVVDGMAVTAPERTAFDLGRTLPERQAWSTSTPWLTRRT